MRSTIYAILVVFSILSPSSWAFSQCLEVQSILVDACDGNGSPEGLNEMFRFRTPNFAVTISEIEVFNGWPSEGINTLPFNGFVQNSATQAKTVELNNTIVSCGYLIEPPNGVIPANKGVLAITSYSVEVSLNSFANLSDTLYIIYHQHTGQGGGHFLNYFTGASNQVQELRLRLTGANPCTEIVSYERALLVDVNGNNVAQNGATVSFTVDGTPSYSNSGCQAPVETFSPNWTSPVTLCSNNPAIDLNTLITGTLGGTWSGPGINGSIFDPSAVSGNVTITYTLQSPNACLSGVTEQSHDIQILETVDASFSNPGDICGDLGTFDLSTLLTGSPGGTWSGNGVTGSSLNIGSINGTTQVTYTVGAGDCLDSQTQTITIIQLGDPVISGTTVYCNGSDLQPLTTIAEPGADVIWYSDALLTELLGTGTSFIPPSPEDATFYVIQTSGACTSSVSSVSIDITFIDPPVGDTLVTFCEGDITPLLSVSGQGTLNWYSDSQLQNLVNTGFSFQPQASSASFFITATIDACISNPFSVQLVEVPLLDALILSPNGTSLCPGTPITLMSSSAGQNLWSSGETTQSIEVDQAGNYSLERTGECNTATDEVTITGLPVFANFTTDQDSGYLVLPVFITDLSSQADACNWYLNGQFLQFTAPGTLMFPDSGSFQLDLICSNSSGCLDTASTIIKVLSDELTLIVPNVFTPNGDFFNELFQVKHNAVKTFQASIFDRWGRFIYSWENVSQGWNGFTQNEKAMDGTYFYIIRGTDIKDKPFEEKGSVLLIGSTD